MTKIKNTKKGMAKKTLSMSLVVAMLATSNVPVWAAEFSDGTDAAVETEAPAAETFSDDATEAPVVENTTDVTDVATGQALWLYLVILKMVALMLQTLIIKFVLMAKKLLVIQELILEVLQVLLI